MGFSSCNRRPLAGAIPGTGRRFGVWKLLPPRRPGQDAPVRASCPRCGAPSSKARRGSGVDAFHALEGGEPAARCQGGTQGARRRPRPAGGRGRRRRLGHRLARRRPEDARCQRPSARPTAARSRPAGCPGPPSSRQSAVSSAGSPPWPRVDAAPRPPPRAPALAGRGSCSARMREQRRRSPSRRPAPSSGSRLRSPSTHERRLRRPGRAALVVAEGRRRRDRRSRSAISSWLRRRFKPSAPSKSGGVGLRGEQVQPPAVRQHHRHVPVRAGRQPQRRRPRRVRERRAVRPPRQRAPGQAAQSRPRKVRARRPRRSAAARAAPCRRCPGTGPSRRRRRGPSSGRRRRDRAPRARRR